MRKLFVFLMVTLFIVAFSTGTYTYAAPTPGEKVKKADDDPTVFIKEKGQKYQCARISWHVPGGSSPPRAKLSKQPVIYVAFKEVTN